ncbi:5-methylcytosine-specific restriction endonuclease system specificity protein McrC [Bifidobacterium catulorum]|uniref:5-methylcytosine-specific restriction endonuclease system specificity protein McrC n=1 Tax=Bifidobacterium catulorum TaxID=1630173 RepID=A0A2U2MTQ9_9BIFI|nr:5-methylcytosine-specific restriction endonuclease system specificity protein McrC [Bifidobacterium catulorum]PWG60260.1 5-methylcytosine-specific restriction endonuclease system specificity protein McrC [Bifidobacterium catulorum]
MTSADLTSSSIPIRNVYYMLSYAFRALREQQYRKLGTESFDNIADLCAAILVQGMSTQIKRGLSREYIPHTDELDSPRGRIEITESARKVTMSRKKLVCTVDDFTVDSHANRIIKSTMLLLTHADVGPIRRAKLRRLLACLDNVGRVDLRRVDWRLRFDRNNQTYRMLIGICRLAVKGLLQSSRPGKTLLMDFLDDQQMHRIYEKFLFGYYSREWRGRIKTTHHRIPWMCPAGVELPVMQPDVVLDNGRDTLIIDAKYYTRTMQRNFDSYTMHSTNMYQMFTYVKNKTFQLSANGDAHIVSGMVLYARTDEERQPDGEFDMDGNRIIVRTLDLNQDFSGISSQLDDIVTRFLPES